MPLAPWPYLRLRPTPLLTFPFPPTPSFPTLDLLETRTVTNYSTPHASLILFALQSHKATRHSHYLSRDMCL